MSERRTLVPAALRERVRALAGRSAEGVSQAMVQAVAQRADRLLARLEGTTDVLDKAARVQLRILEKLEPIVDDLGTLVRTQLAQSLGRTPPDRQPSRPHDDIIDVTDLNDERGGAGGPLDSRASRKSR